jgi:hypothetical protein
MGHPNYGWATRQLVVHERPPMLTLRRHRLAVLVLSIVVNVDCSAVASQQMGVKAEAETIVQQVDADLSHFRSNRDPHDLSKALTVLESFSMDQRKIANERPSLQRLAEGWLGVIGLIEKDTDHTWTATTNAPLVRVPPPPEDPNERRQYDDWLQTYNKSVAVYRFQDELRALDRRATVNFTTLFANQYFLRSENDLESLQALMKAKSISKAKQQQLELRFKIAD